jgi:hypothetical protein
MHDTSTMVRWFSTLAQLTHRDAGICNDYFMCWGWYSRFTFMCHGSRGLRASAAHGGSNQAVNPQAALESIAWKVDRASQEPAHIQHWRSHGNTRRASALKARIESSGKSHLPTQLSICPVRHNNKMAPSTTHGSRQAVRHSSSIWFNSKPSIVHLALPLITAPTPQTPGGTQRYDTHALYPATTTSSAQCRRAAPK